MLKIPKYVIEIMERSQYEFYYFKSKEGYSAGYTIRICKATPYTRIDTMRAELERLCKWADKIGGEGTGIVLDIPLTTHYKNQYAIVTIFDPVMKQIEKYIRK